MKKLKDSEIQWSLKKKLFEEGAVSYTHLDVYKRQIQDHEVLKNANEGDESPE